MRLLLLLAALIFAPPALSQPRESITVGMSQFPPDMHPYITSTSVRNFVLQAMTRTMVGLAADGTQVCVLCTALPSLEAGTARLTRRADGSEGMEVEYTLRPDLFWADGVQLTAKDVAFSFSVNSAFSVPLVIETVTAEDALRVRFTLRSPVYDYQRIASFFILPEHVEAPLFAAAKDPLDYGRRTAFNRRPEEPGLWSGPFRVAEFVPNDRIVMVPNAHWQGRPPAFRRVTLRLVENTAALLANLLSGDVDTVATANMGLTLDQTLNLARTQAARFEFEFRPSLGSYEHLAVNHDNPLLADRRVRRALSMAIDRQTITARLFESRFTPALTFLHPSERNFAPEVKAWPYDPAAARALLAEAGFRPGPDGILRSAQGVPLSIDLITTAGNRTRELVGQVLQTQLKAIGVALVIKNEPARVMFGETLRRRTFGGLVEFDGGAGIDAVPMDMFASHYVPTAENAWAGRNYGGFRNAAMDAALAAARAELDPEARRGKWQRIQEIYAEELPAIPLYFAATAIITPKWATGLANPARLGYPTAWIEDWRPR